MIGRDRLERKPIQLPGNLCTFAIYGTNTRGIWKRLSIVQENCESMFQDLNHIVLHVIAHTQFRSEKILLKQTYLAVNKTSG